MTQIKAAQDRADAREQAAESVKSAAEEKVFQAKAGALLAKLPRGQSASRPHRAHRETRAKTASASLRAS